MSRHVPRPCRHSAAVCPKVRRRRGLTLVEMLVAMAVSLILVLGVAQMFAVVGDRVSTARATLDMAGQLRATSTRLQRDLEGLTVPVRPWADSFSSMGFLEYVEGRGHDRYVLEDATIPPALQDSMLGDIDDVLACTIRTTGTPFVGQILGTLAPETVNTSGTPTWTGRYIVQPPTTPDTYTTISSTVAEVVWWLTLDESQASGGNGDGIRQYGENYLLHRRLFLVVPNLIFSANYNTLSRGQFHDVMDVSCRFEFDVANNTSRWVPNSLEDLTRREYRYAHALFEPATNNPITQATLINGFPFSLQPATAPDPRTPFNLTLLSSQRDWTDNDPNTVLPQFVPLNDINGNAVNHRLLRQGNDVILSQVLAFDVRGFDPTVPILSDTSTVDAVAPGDPGYRAAIAAGGTVTLGTGEYVDLFYSRHVPGSLNFSTFSNSPQSNSGLQSPLGPAVYDTWSTHYEYDGLDQFGDGVIDRGFNALDDNSLAGIDDIAERETMPPYPVPMRGLQIRIRVIDNDTRQVRQVTVTTDFTPNRDSHSRNVFNRAGRGRISS